MAKTNFFVHPTAEVHPDALIGDGTKIWNWAQVREEAVIGRLCVISKGVYIDRGVVVGDMVKIQNNASIYKGVTIEDGVFVGPHVCFSNDLSPRAVGEALEPITEDDWAIEETRVQRGASIGANVSVLAGVKIGEFALIGMGAVVTKDVPDYALAYGNPATVKGSVDSAGQKIKSQRVLGSS